MTTATAQSKSRQASLMYRLCYTPLRDVLRGRLSARLDLESMIAAADLPQPLADRVRAVVRLTRLWRLEKADVARELAAHFRDGLDSGACAESLAASFGAPKQAARLIRRSKKRNRPLPWRLLVRATRGLAVFFSLLVVVYVGLELRLHLGSANLARNYWTEFNAPTLATPQAERAWPVYRQAALAIRGQSEEAMRSKPDPNEPGWEHVVACVEENREAISLFRAGASRARLGLLLNPGEDVELSQHCAQLGLVPHTEEWGNAAPATIAENPPLLRVRYQELGVLRHGVRLLQRDACVAAAAGDSERMCADLEAALRMVNHVSETPFVVMDLVAVAILKTATSTLGTQLHQRPELFSDEQLVRLAHSLGAVRGGERFRLQLAGERAFFRDVVQRLYTDDAEGDGHPVPEYLHLLQSLQAAAWHAPWTGGGNLAERMVMPAFSAVLIGRRELVQKYDYFMSLVEAEAESPLWQRDSSKADAEFLQFSDSSVNQLRYMPVTLFIPCLSRASFSLEIGTQERDAAQVAIALELHRRRHGCWPASLDELTPSLLPQVPPDRYDGQPLKYRLIGGQPVLYSVGVDRDDDGGRLPDPEQLPRHMRAQPNRWAREWRPPSDLQARSPGPGWEPVPDGDWILWPATE